MHRAAQHMEVLMQARCCRGMLHRSRPTAAATGVRPLPGRWACAVERQQAGWQQRKTKRNVTSDSRQVPHGTTNDAHRRLTSRF